VIFLPVGAIFAGIGFIDFFGAFFGGGFPTKFWCAFVGLPMLAFGIFCFKVGFLRTISGYVAGETAPVVRDTVSYVADGLKPAMRSMVDDLRQTPLHSDPAERMQHLEDLKEQGLISDAEYTSKRQEILKEI